MPPDRHDGAPAQVPAGAAAHHPVTARVATDVLRAGGRAADAAVAGVFASCVAESLLTGLAGGGFAICWDAEEERALTLDFFVDVPRHPATADLHHVPIDFGAHVVPYAIGPATVAVPGLVAGLGALWERRGVVPWPDLLEPAMRLAVEGCDMPAQHAAVLDMLAAVMTLGGGERIYAPRGRPLAPGERLVQPGLATAMRIIAEEGPSAFTTGTLARQTAALMAERGGGVRMDDLAGYRPRWGAPGVLDRGRHRVMSRDDLAGVRRVIAAVDEAGPVGPAGRAVAAARALRSLGRTGTTTLTVVDERGDAVVVSSSMGLSSGDWLPDLDLHLNSMLGERDLLIDEPVPGERLASNMVPTLVVDDAGLVLAGGAAGSSRIPSVLVQVLLAVLDDGMLPQDAVDAPRWHVDADAVHHEAGVDPEVVEALTGLAGRSVEWAGRHYYFGGVTLVARNGAAYDVRRSGGVAMVDDLRER